ncbi:hypothetical protein A7U60_g6317 [Sanghuangporus baumii]|uniref:Chromatin target of PRMT1 protein C-terminal domain-containing protein n=1 Tax=Sanghuangporus baumii TaxID=108892 RepID=A0A9Q5HV91_SANBA|nr:hypothetical protein A7U60_g6317 [Sanghuangporus baumii]
MPRAPSGRLNKPYDRPSSDEKWVHDRAPVGVPKSVVKAGAAPKSLGGGNVPTNRIVVSNLHYEIMAKDLVSIFGQIGQPMEITYDTRSMKHTGGAGGPKSLLNRISKPPLIERLRSEGLGLKGIKSEPTKTVTNGGPIRTRGPRKVQNEIGGAKGEKFRKEPKTAEDLDKELEAFMNDEPVRPGESAAPATSAPTRAQVGDVDVEMGA